MMAGAAIAPYTHTTPIEIPIPSHCVQIGQLILPLAIVASTTCSEPAAPPPAKPPEPIVVAFVDTALLLSTIGATRDLAVSVTQGGTARALRVYWWSASDSIARVSDVGRVSARRRGYTWVYAVSDSGGIDSVLVSVAPVVASLALPDGSIALLRGRSRTVARAAADSAGTPVAQPRVVWSVADTAIASVDVNGRVTAKAVGLTTVRAEIEGRAAIFATASLAVTLPPALRLPRDTIVLVAGTRLHVPPVVTADSVGATEQATVTAVVFDTAIASVTSTFRVPYRIDGEPTMQLIGRRVGTTRVRFSAPGWLDTVAVLSVRQPQLGAARRRTIEIDYPSFDPNGSFTGVASYLTHPDQLEVRALTPFEVRFANSDSSFLRMTVDLAIADGVEPAIARFEILRAGAGQILATSPGVLPETIDVRTRVKGFRFDQYGNERTNDTVQVGYRSRFSLRSSAFLPVAPAVQPVTLTQRRPDLLQLSTTPIELKWFAPQPSFSFVGLATGVDTLIASAPGHAPDTLIVQVVPPLLRRITTPSTIEFLDTPSIVSPIAEWAGAEPVTLRITSSAPAVLQTESAYITIPQATDYAVRLRPTGIGVATLTFTDTTGAHPPLVLDPITVRLSDLRIIFPELPAGGASLGVRQRRNLSVGTSWWAGAAGRSGTLRSSDTSVVRLTETSFGTLPFTTDIESGDVPGTAWIVVTSLGLTTDSVKVTVTRGLIDLGPGAAYRADFSPFTMNVLVRDAAGNQRITRDSLFIKVRSSNRDRISLLDSIVVIPAGASFSGPIRFNALRVGPVGVTAVPMQPLRPNIDAGGTGFVVIRP